MLLQFNILGVETLKSPKGLIGKEMSYKGRGQARRIYWHKSAPQKLLS
jgi:hypothetical protein